MLSQSPMSYAYKANEALAQIEAKYGKQVADYLRNNYARVSGGGGGGIMPFMPPGPSGPDYSQIDLLQTLGGGSSNQGYGNAIIRALPSLFKTFS
jgi:hypothetical protein